MPTHLTPVAPVNAPATVNEPCLTLSMASQEEPMANMHMHMHMHAHLHLHMHVHMHAHVHVHMRMHPRRRSSWPSSAHSS